jgi:hypothetical protein
MPRSVTVPVGEIVRQRQTQGPVDQPGRSGIEPDAKLLPTGLIKRGLTHRGGSGQQNVPLQLVVHAQLAGAVGVA